MNDTTDKNSSKFGFNPYPVVDSIEVSPTSESDSLGGILRDVSSVDSNDIPVDTEVINELGSQLERKFNQRLLRSSIKNEDINEIQAPPEVIDQNWSLGENLSTNKLSMLLNNMQERLNIQDTDATSQMNTNQVMPSLEPKNIKARVGGRVVKPSKSNDDASQSNSSIGSSGKRSSTGGMKPANTIKNSASSSHRSSFPSKEVLTVQNNQTSNPIKSSTSKSIIHNTAGRARTPPIIKPQTHDSSQRAFAPQVIKPTPVTSSSRMKTATSMENPLIANHQFSSITNPLNDKKPRPHSSNSIPIKDPVSPSNKIRSLTPTVIPKSKFATTSSNIESSGMRKDVSATTNRKPVTTSSSVIRSSIRSSLDSKPVNTTDSRSKGSVARRSTMSGVASNSLSSRQSSTVSSSANRNKSTRSSFPIPNSSSTMVSSTSRDPISRTTERKSLQPAKSNIPHPSKSKPSDKRITTPSSTNRPNSLMGSSMTDTGSVRSRSSIPSAVRSPILEQNPLSQNKASPIIGETVTSGAAVAAAAAANGAVSLTRIHIDSLHPTLGSAFGRCLTPNALTAKRKGRLSATDTMLENTNRPVLEITNEMTISAQGDDSNQKRIHDSDFSYDDLTPTPRKKRSHSIHSGDDPSGLVPSDVVINIPSRSNYRNYMESDQSVSLDSKISSLHPSDWNPAVTMVPHNIKYRTGLIPFNFSAANRRNSTGSSLKSSSEDSPPLGLTRNSSRSSYSNSSPANYSGGRSPIRATIFQSQSLDTQRSLDYTENPHHSLAASQDHVNQLVIPSNISTKGFASNYYLKKSLDENEKNELEDANKIPDTSYEKVHLDPEIDQMVDIPSADYNDGTLILEPIETPRSNFEEEKPTEMKKTGVSFPFSDPIKIDEEDVNPLHSPKLSIERKISSSTLVLNSTPNSLAPSRSTSFRIDSTSKHDSITKEREKLRRLFDNNLFDDVAPLIEETGRESEKDGFTRVNVGYTSDSSNEASKLPVKSRTTAQSTDEPSPSFNLSTGIASPEKTRTLKKVGSRNISFYSTASYATTTSYDSYDGTETHDLPKPEKKHRPLERKLSARLTDHIEQIKKDSVLLPTSSYPDELGIYMCGHQTISLDRLKSMYHTYEDLCDSTPKDNPLKHRNETSSGGRFGADAKQPLPLIFPYDLLVQIDIFQQPQEIKMSSRNSNPKDIYGSVVIPEKTPFPAISSVPPRHGPRSNSSRGPAAVSSYTKYLTRTQSMLPVPTKSNRKVKPMVLEAVGEDYYNPSESSDFEYIRPDGNASVGDVRRSIVSNDSMAVDSDLEINSIVPTQKSSNTLKIQKPNAALVDAKPNEKKSLMVDVDVAGSSSNLPTAPLSPTQLALKMMPTTPFSSTPRTLKRGVSTAAVVQRTRSDNMEDGFGLLTDSGSSKQTKKLITKRSNVGDEIKESMLDDSDILDPYSIYSNDETEHSELFQSPSAVISGLMSVQLSNTTSPKNPDDSIRKSLFYGFGKVKSTHKNLPSNGVLADGEDDVPTEVEHNFSNENQAEIKDESVTDQLSKQTDYNTEYNSGRIF